MATSSYDFSGSSGNVGGPFVLGSDPGTSATLKQDGSGRGALNASTGVLLESRDTTTFAADCRAQIVATDVNPGFGYAIRIGLRITAGGNGYRAAFVGYSNEFVILRVDSWVETGVGAAVSGALADADILKFEVIGSTLNLYQGASLVMTRSDATYGAAGSAYLGMIGDNNFLVDDWYAEDISAGSTSLPLARRMARMSSHFR